MTTTLLFIGVLLLAYYNGANDNFKGVATLLGSKTTNYRKAINWGTALTLIGSLTALFVADKLVHNFSGKGLVPDALIQSPAFAISVALGAGLTILLSTIIGMPVSTTHALVGALTGIGVLVVGSAFNFAHLSSAFLVPLLVSPLLALGASMILYFLLHKGRVRLGIKRDSCVCVGEEYIPVDQVTNAGVASVATQGGLKGVVGTEKECVTRYSGTFVGLSVHKALDVMHYLSGGAVSFARGLNDTPKILGLLLVANALDIRWGLAAIGVVMAVGGLLNARKVGITVADKITPMNHGQGFAANLVTALLTTTASVHGMPVSTTHVSVGSIFGIGTVTRKADYKVVGQIVTAWVLTLPAGALLGGLSYYMISILT